MTEVYIVGGSVRDNLPRRAFKSGFQISEVGVPKTRSYRVFYEAAPLQKFLPLRTKLSSGCRLKTHFGTFCGNLMSSGKRNMLDRSSFCACCGLRATLLILETDRTAHEKGLSPHLNAYALVDGHYILFTKDHIIPKSCGGSDNISNLQTMCEPCNSLKSNRQGVSMGALLLERIQVGRL